MTSDMQGKKKALIWIGVVFAIIAMAIGGYYWLHQKPEQKEFTGHREKVTIGFLPNMLSSLVLIAEAKGFFMQEGLDITLKSYPTGRDTLIAMIAKEIDIAVTGDLGLVVSSLERDDFAVLATIGSSSNAFKIVSRTDKARLPKDLKGKRIATQKDTQMHFFLHLFLLKNGLSEEDVKISFKKAGELALTLASGEVDAISAREPIISQARGLLPDKAIVFEEPEFFQSTYNFAALKVLLKERPEAMQKVIRALLKAEGFARKYPEEAVDIVSQKIGVDKSTIASDWENAELMVSLSQRLLLTFESEARWAIKNKDTGKTNIPNYLDFIYFDGLMAVKPDAVTIIH